MKRLLVFLFVLIIFAFVFIQCKQSGQKSTVSSGYELIRIDCNARKAYPQLPPWSFVYQFEVSVNYQEKIKWVEINGKNLRLEGFVDTNSPQSPANPCDETVNGTLGGRICTAKVHTGYYKYNVVCSDYGLTIDPMIKIPREVFVKRQ